MRGKMLIKKRYHLLLFNPDGQLKTAGYYNKMLDAYRAGQNWEMLTNGNKYQIEEENI